MITRECKAGGVADHPLDNAVWSSLAGPHAAFAERKGRAARYLTDICPFAAIPEVPDEQDWSDLAALAGPGREVIIFGPPRTPPAGWEIGPVIPGVQMDGSGMDVAPDPEAVILGADDVAEMLDLVARTRPGPFLPRTPVLGTYVGFRHGGALVAMAGERMRPPGWTEISAVCTDPAFRGRGLAGRLVRAVGAVIVQRGDRPLLHAAASNEFALGLYERLGFVRHGYPLFTGLRTPTDAYDPAPPPAREDA